MMIEKILRKLEPLLPEKVRAWRRSLDLVDADLRVLVEKQILATAHKRLGNFRNRLLLSLPPEDLIRGKLNLGTVLYEREKWPAGLSHGELLQNLAVFGRSGGGKTNVAFHLLKQLASHKVSFLFLDWKRTARHLLPDLPTKVRIYTPGRQLVRFPFNPFIPPPGLEAGVYANHVVDVLGDAYTLGDAARSVLQKALRTCYGEKRSPMVADVLRAVEALPDKERVRGWKVSALRALETLSALELAEDAQTQASMVASIAQGSTIVELDSLAPSNKKLLVPLLCLWLYYMMLPRPQRERLSLVIVLEEAHNVLYDRAGRESLMSMLLRQCREIGIAMIVIDQHPSLIGSAALGNTYTTICLNLKDPKDINKAAALSLVSDEDKRHFSMLPVGCGVVKKQDRWQLPFLVRFPLVAVQKGIVTDEVLARVLSGDGTLSALSGANRKEKPEMKLDRHSRVSADALTPPERRFLSDVAAHPDDGVDVRYKRLSLSADAGNQVKRKLLERGMIEEERVQIGRTRRVLLRLRSDPSDASLTHSYWQRCYAKKLLALGYRVQLEAPRKRGRVDVLGTRGSESVAVEVETGKSDVVWNVQQDLLSGFDRVIVVATDEDAFLRVEQKLGKEGLLLKRVRVVLRDADNIETLQ